MKEIIQALKDGLSAMQNLGYDKTPVKCCGNGWTYENAKKALQQAEALDR